MDNSKAHIVYSAADIERYLSGKMSNEEMHAMEKAALNDQLLAEAIEGYSGMNENDWVATLGELRNKIASEQNTPVILLKNRQTRANWKVAAAVAILLSGAGLAYFAANKKEPVIIAKQQSQQAGSDIATADSVTDTTTHQLVKTESELPGASAETKSSQGIKLQDSSSNFSASRQYKDEDSKTDFVYTPKIKQLEKPVVSGGGVYNNSSADTTSTTSSYNSNAGRLSNEVSSSNNLSNDNFKRADNFSDKEVVKSRKTPASNSNHLNSFNGLVIAKDNTPLAFAQVSTNSTKQPVYTDKNGFFKILSTDTILKAEVNSAGYETKTITFRPTDADKKIILEPAAVAEKQLSSGKEKTDLAKGKSRVEQQKEVEEQEEEEATPVIGWEDYNNYLNTNGNISNKDIHGVVEVFVNLDKNGTISKIKVDKSLCAECDAEAVRLVKEGPKWDVKTNKARRVKVKVRF